MKILNNYQIITLQNYVKNELFILFSQGKLRLDGKFPECVSSHAPGARSRCTRCRAPEAADLIDMGLSYKQWPLENGWFLFIIIYHQKIQQTKYWNMKGNDDKTMGCGLINAQTSPKSSGCSIILAHTHIQTSRLLSWSAVRWVCLKGEVCSLLP